MMGMNPMKTRVAHTAAITTRLIGANRANAVL
jgi:hypothetical protein